MGAIEHMQRFLSGKKQIVTPSVTIPLDSPLPPDFWDKTPSASEMPTDLEVGEIEQSDAQRALATDNFNARHVSQHQRSPRPSNSGPSGKNARKRPKKNSQPYSCKLCGVHVHGRSVLESHVRGKAHHTRLRQARLAGRNEEIAEHGRVAALAAGLTTRRDEDSPSRISQPPRLPHSPNDSAPDKYSRASKASKDDALMSPTQHLSTTRVPYYSPASSLSKHAPHSHSEPPVTNANRTVTPDPMAASLIEEDPPNPLHRKDKRKHTSNESPILRGHATSDHSTHAGSVGKPHITNIGRLQSSDGTGRIFEPLSSKSSIPSTNQPKRFQPVSSDPTISRSRPSASSSQLPSPTQTDTLGADKNTGIDHITLLSPDNGTEKQTKRRKPDEDDEIGKSSIERQRLRSRSEERAPTYAMSADGSQRRKLNLPAVPEDQIQRVRSPAYKEKEHNEKKQSEQRRRSNDLDRNFVGDERRREEERRRNRDDRASSGDLDTRSIIESRMSSKDDHRRDSDDRRRSGDLERWDNGDDRRHASPTDRERRDGFDDRRRSSERGRRDILDDWRRQADRDRPDAADERWRSIERERHEGGDSRRGKRPPDRRRSGEDKRGYSPEKGRRRSPSDEIQTQAISYEFLREVMPMAEWRELRHSVLERGTDVDKLAYKILQELIISPVAGVDVHTLAPFSRAMLRSLSKQFVTEVGPVAKRADFPAELRWLDCAFDGYHGTMDKKYSKRPDEHCALWNIRDNVWFTFNNHEQPDRSKGPTRAQHPPRGKYGEGKLRRPNGMPHTWDRSMSRYDDGIVTDPLFQAIMESLIRREEQGPVAVPSSAVPPGSSPSTQ